MKKFLLCVLMLLLSVGCWPWRHKGADIAFPAPMPAQELYAKAMEFYERNNFIDSQQLFQACRTRYPISEWGINSALKMADCLYYLKQYENALVQYQEFTRLHPTHQFVDYAYYQMGMCYYRQLCKLDRDQTPTVEAIKHFESLLTLFPASAYVPSAQEKIAEAKKRLADHVLCIADYYYRTGAYVSALHRYRQAMTEYPEQLSEPARVLFQLGKAYLHIEQPDNARVQFATLIAQYPESPWAAPSQTLLDNPAGLPDMDENPFSQLFGKLNPFQAFGSAEEKNAKDKEPQPPAEGE